MEEGAAVSRVVWRYGGAAVRSVVVPAVLLAALPSYHLAAQAQDAENSRGKELYERWCAECHGEAGAGDGSAAAYMLPRPRDFRGALYQIRTTASGELPTDDDLRRVIVEGMPGTAMAGWRARLSSRERDDVIAYIKTFSRFFQGAEPQPLEFSREPSSSDAGIAEGARVYRELECFKCHGDAGRGDGQSAPTMTDDWDFPIRPADLTRPWSFNGGGEVGQVYRRLRTGLDGTPMPSFADVVDAEVITDEQLWRLAQYVGSLASRLPVVREVVRARRIEGELPAGPADTAWTAVEAFYVPLVGQIIVAPRWFTPTVDGIWVRALHDGERLAIHIEWSDPSASPDPVWQDWLDLVARTVQDADGPVEPVQGADRLAIQFPARRSDGMQRPYFLAGDARRPVYTWRWSSSPDQLEVGTATGLGRFTAGDNSGVVHAAEWVEGRWQLQVTRSLVAGDSAVAPNFAEGEAIPIAFQAADGSSGEDGFRGSVSTWYAIYLDVPNPPSVFVMPLVAVLVTAGLGALAVVRAQRRAHGS